MAIFSRRRIQNMLDDIDPLLDERKRADLVNRLNNKRVEQSLPAEMELALTWAMRHFKHVEIEPEWWPEGKMPDVYVEGLVGSLPAIVEIASTNDNSISAEELMDKCVQEIVGFANSVEKGSGEFLYFGFAETRKQERGRSVRGVAAPKRFRMSDAARTQVRRWLQSEVGANSPLTLIEEGLHVVIERKPYKQIRYHNFWTTRPPRTYSETDNPIYELLRKKLSQVEGAPSGTKRVIFLADVGSRTLADIHSSFANPGLEAHATAKKIVLRFLADKRGRVDAVIVFSPEQRQVGFMRQHEPGWRISVFSETSENDLLAGLEVLKAQLPSPRFSGSQARSLFRQRAFEHDARGWYLGAGMTTSNKGITYRISARALQDFLAGRITEKQFREFIGERSDGPSFARYLNAGMTISDTSFHSAGVDEDDDHLEFKLSPDPAAKPFE
ncbi:MAG: hypothetical protein ACU0BN_09640 [Sulfitobacter sp.]